MYHLLQHDGRNFCHFIPDVLFQVHRSPCCTFIHLALEISSEKEVSVVEISKSCRPFNIPSSWDHTSWEHVVENSLCEPLPHLTEIRESGFQHQVSSTPVPEMCKASQCGGLNLLLLPCCLVFKEIGVDHPKTWYCIPHQPITFSECEGFWWISWGFRLASGDSFENWHCHKDENFLHLLWECG
jgi:hypothetical protein